MSTEGTGVVRAVCVGSIREYPPGADGRTMRTAIRKEPVAGRVRVHESGLEGDETTHAGGRWIHAHVFPGDDYAWLEARAGRALAVPSFGENLVVDGISDATVRVGDVVRVGTAELEVTQPTVRCVTVAWNTGLPEILKWLEERECCGFYVRVRTPGDVGAGDRWETVRRGDPAWTISRLHRAMGRELADGALMERLLALPELSDDWKASLRRRIARSRPAS